MGVEEELEVLRICRSRSLYRYYGTDPQGEVTAFEQEFSAYLGVRHAVAVSSGTTALYCALAALGVGPGQEVIVPAYLWVSVVAAVVNLGAIPVLAEIDDTFCLSANSVLAQVTPRTTGIIVVHMSGAPADVAPLVALARDRGLFLLEDCAQCVGGAIDGKKVGSFGNIAVFSFQVNKNMSSGEAGCIVTNDESLYRRAQASQDSGYARDEDNRLRLEAGSVFGWGRGCRLDELRAAILRVQLRRLPTVIAAMHRSKYKLRSLLAELPAIQWRRVPDMSGDTGCFLLTTFSDASRARFVNARLRLHGIVTRHPQASTVILEDYGLHVYFNIPALVNKIGTDRRGTPWALVENRESKVAYTRGTCPKSDSLFARTQLLTIASCLSSRDEDDIVAAFHDALA